MTKNVDSPDIPIKNVSVSSVSDFLVQPLLVYIFFHINLFTQMRSQRGSRWMATPLIAKGEFCNSSKSVEKLKGGKLYFSPKLMAAWFANVKKET